MIKRKCRLKKRISDRSKSRYQLFFTALLVTVIALSSACNRRSAPGGQRRAAAEERAVPVIVEEVTHRPLAEHINITGKLEGITDVTMLSETTGRVLSLAKSLGDWINEGEKIGRIDNEVFRIRHNQAEAALASAVAALENARMNYLSASKLLENGSVSQAEYQQALFAHQSAIAQRDGAAAALESARKAYDNSRLIAPVSGYISYLPLKIGETIFPNSPIAGIVNHKQLFLKGGVGEDFIVSLRKGQPVIVSYKGNDFPAEVYGVGVRPLGNSASYPVEIILDNSKGELLPGMVVTASIKVNLYQDIIFTDSANIRASYDDSYVYTINENSEAVRTVIRQGRSVNNFTIIEEGLETGMQIVVEGIDSLEEGIKVDVRN